MQFLNCFAVVKLQKKHSAVLLLLQFLKLFVIKIGKIFGGKFHFKTTFRCRRSNRLLPVKGNITSPAVTQIRVRYYQKFALFLLDIGGRDADFTLRYAVKHTFLQKRIHNYFYCPAPNIVAYTELARRRQKVAFVTSEEKIFPELI